MDDKNPNAPSRLAAGIINPVTGRRHVSTWMIDTLLPYVWEKYTTLGNELGITAIPQKNVTDFFPSPQMRESFIKRVDEKGEYVTAVSYTHLDVYKRQCRCRSRHRLFQKGH